MSNVLRLFYVVLVIFQGYCLSFFLRSFLESRWNSGWNSFCVTVLYAVGLYGMSEIAFERNWSTDRVAIGKQVLSLCVLLFLTFCFYKAFRPITAFLIVSFQAVADISKYVAVIALGKVGDSMIDLWNWCVERGVFPSEKALMLTLNSVVFVIQLFQYLFAALLFYYSLKRIVCDFREKDYEIRRTELLFLLAPSAVSMFICILLRTIMITIEGNMPEMLYDKYPALILVLPAILLLSLLSILCGVKLFQDMIYRNKEKSEKVILKNQINGMREHMEEMERVYSEIRGIKHDMKNTLTVIQQLSIEENARLREYLSDLNQTFERLEMRFRTGNTVADTLLNMKYHEAARLIPDLKMDTEKLLFPKNLNIHSYDIGVILGNAADNAIEACRKRKEKEPEAEVFIRFVSWQKGNLLVLKVENSFDGKLVRKPQKEFPVTDKPDKENHGMGLTNIKNTVEKYHGAMDFKVEGKVFILSVMMKNEKVG